MIIVPHIKSEVRTTCKQNWLFSEQPSQTLRAFFQTKFNENTTVKHWNTISGFWRHRWFFCWFCCFLCRPLQQRSIIRSANGSICVCGSYDQTVRAAIDSCDARTRARSVRRHGTRASTRTARSSRSSATRRLSASGSRNSRPTASRDKRSWHSPTGIMGRTSLRKLRSGYRLSCFLGIQIDYDLLLI